MFSLNGMPLTFNNKNATKMEVFAIAMTEASAVNVDHHGTPRRQDAVIESGKILKGNTEKLVLLIQVDQNLMIVNTTQNNAAPKLTDSWT